MAAGVSVALPVVPVNLSPDPSPHPVARFYSSAAQDKNRDELFVRLPQFGTNVRNIQISRNTHDILKIISSKLTLNCPKYELKLQHK